MRVVMWLAGVGVIVCGLIFFASGADNSRISDGMVTVSCLFGAVAAVVFALLAVRQGRLNRQRDMTEAIRKVQER